MGERIERERVRVVTPEAHRVEKKAAVTTHIERLPRLGETDRALVRTLKGESQFERGTKPALERHEWKPPEGVPTGFKGAAVNVGGATIGLLEKYAGLKFKVNPYFMPVTFELARSSRPEGNDMMRWANAGYTAVVSLTAETDRFTLDAKAMGLNAVRVPIIDNTAREKIFSSKEAQNKWMDAQIKTIADFVRGNKKTVVHCQAGIGRTGMVIACLQMALYGMSERDAVAEAIRVAQEKNRVQRVVMVPAQLAYVHHFAEALRRGEIPGYPLA